MGTDENEHRGGAGTQDVSLPAQRGSDVSIRVGTQNRSLTLPSGGRACDVYFYTGLHWRTGDTDSSGHSSYHSGRMITNVIKWVYVTVTKMDEGGTRGREGMGWTRPSWQQGCLYVGTQPSGHRDVRTLLKAAKAELSSVTPIGNTRKCLHTHRLGNSTRIYVKIQPEPSAPQLMGNMKLLAGRPTFLGLEPTAGGGPHVAQKYAQGT